MAHSDNTVPAYSYPRGRDFKKHWRRPRVKGARRRERTAIASGREPVPLQYRHGGLWASQ